MIPAYSCHLFFCGNQKKPLEVSSKKTWKVYIAGNSQCFHQVEVVVFNIFFEFSPLTYLVYFFFQFDDLRIFQMG